MTKELDYLITKVVQETTISELNQIVSALKLKLAQRQEAEIEKAKQAFVKAYAELRKLAPFEDCYIDIYNENGELLTQEDLFGLMDEEFLRGE